MKFISHNVPVTSVAYFKLILSNFT